MKEIKKQFLLYPKTVFSLNNQKELKSMKKRIRSIKKDFNIFSNIYTGRSNDHSFFAKNEKKLSLLSKLNNKKLQNNLNVSFARKTISEQRINYIKIKKKYETPRESHKRNKSMTPSPNKNIQLIKLDSNKQDICPETTRINFKNSFFKNEFVNEPKNDLQSIFNNKLIKIKLLNNGKIRNLLKRNKSQMNNSSTNRLLKKLLISSNKKFIEKIESIEKKVEKEEEKILSDKNRNDKIIKRIKILTKFNKGFEIQFKKDANSYQKDIGLFYRTKSTGLYTSHFHTILRQDNIFSNDIIHKMPQYYHFVN